MSKWRILMCKSQSLKELNMISIFAELCVTVHNYVRQQQFMIMLRDEVIGNVTEMCLSGENWCQLKMLTTCANVLNKNCCLLEARAICWLKFVWHAVWHRHVIGRGGFKAESLLSHITRKASSPLPPLSPPSPPSPPLSSPPLFPTLPSLRSRPLKSS